MLFSLKTHFYKLNTLDEVENAENWNSLKWVRNDLKVAQQCNYKILIENKRLKYIAW